MTRIEKTFLFLVAVMFINPDARKGRVNLKAEYIISVTWPEHLRDDIDLWVQDPIGETVSYLRKDAGWLHLDRDDRGEVNDTILVDGEDTYERIVEFVDQVQPSLLGRCCWSMGQTAVIGPSPDFSGPRRWPRMSMNS